MSERIGGGTVLVIDDDDDLLIEMSGAIRRLGCTVYTADSAKAAVSLVEQHALINVIIIDEVLPDMRGTDVYSDIKARLTDREIRAILLTGYADIDICIKALRIGFYDLIQKPANFSEIRNSLARALNDVNRAHSGTSDKITNTTLKLFVRLPHSNKTGNMFTLDRDKLSIIAVAYDYWNRNEKLLTKTVSLITGVPLSSVIRHLDELSELDLIRRRDDPTDRRRTLIELTGKGSDYIAAITASIRDAIA